MLQPDLSCVAGIKEGAVYVFPFLHKDEMIKM